MVELGQLEAHHQEFERRNVRVAVASLEEPARAELTQASFPHLTVIADISRGLSQALNVIHPESAPGGGDTDAPTTLLIDGDGTVRWVFRPDRFLTRLTPAEVLAAIDAHMPVR